MTISELYTVAGPVTATMLLFFSPIGIFAVFIWLINKLFLSPPDLCRCKKCGHFQQGNGWDDT